MTTTDTALLLLDLQNEIVDPKGKAGAEGLAGPVAERKVLKRTADLLKQVRAKRPLPSCLVLERSPPHRSGYNPWDGLYSWIDEDATPRPD